MRVTVDIDDDVVAAARALADQNESSLGSALSELARRGFRSASPARHDRDPTVFAVAAAAAEPFTSEDVCRSLAEWP